MSYICNGIYILHIPVFILYHHISVSCVFYFIFLSKELYFAPEKPNTAVFLRCN